MRERTDLFILETRRYWKVWQPLLTTLAWLSVLLLVVLVGVVISKAPFAGLAEKLFILDRNVTLIHKATLTTPGPEPGEDAKMAVKYEDNFGFWEIDCPDEHAFFENVKSQSIRAICQRCDRLVRLMPTKTMCAPCVSALECGAPRTMTKYRRAGPKTAQGL